MSFQSKQCRSNCYCENSFFCLILRIVLIINDFLCRVMSIFQLKMKQLYKLLLLMLVQSVLQLMLHAVHFNFIHQVFMMTQHVQQQISIIHLFSLDMIHLTMAQFRKIIISLKILGVTHGEQKVIFGWAEIKIINVELQISAVIQQFNESVFCFCLKIKVNHSVIY